MNVKKLNIIFGLLVLFSTSLYAKTVELDSASTNYKNGNYEKAIGFYSDLIESGYESSELYYNLGCSYFKINNLPQAILYFEKAKLQSPGDEDINYNLEFARSFIVDKIEVLPPFFLNQWYITLRSVFSTNGWAYFSIGTFCFFLLLLLFYFFTRKIFVKKLTFWFSLLFLIISIVSFSFSYKQYKMITERTGAIVFNPTVTLKSSPDEIGTDLFILHEGTKVFIEENIGDWYRIKLPDGSVGWLKESDIRKI
ncbi:MAG: tetratricopeptide repeat protein [Bacteroidota bacterium]